MVAGAIWIVSGLPGSGKTTVARSLSQRFQRSIHISGDDVRDMVVSGFVSGLDDWTEEHSRQFDLSWRSEAVLAAIYVDAGFVAVVDDFVREVDVARCFMPALRGHEIHKVFLAPTVEVALTRNTMRRSKNFDTARLIPIIRRLEEPAREGLDTWIVIDSSSLDVGETVDAILRSAVSPELPGADSAKA